MIINQANLGIIFTAFKAAFSRAFGGDDTQYQKVATVVPSSTKEEKYGWLGQWPRLREWLGDRHVQNLALHDYSIRNKTFESTVAVPREDIEDDTYGIFTPLFAEMGDAAKKHPDELVFGLLAAGFTTPCFDGQYFFDTDHKVAGASVANMHVGGANKPWFLLDASRPLKPIILQKRRDYAFQSMTKTEDERVFTAKEFRFGIDARLNVGFGFWQMAFGSKLALDTDNFNDAYQKMMAFKSDEGRPLGIKPTLLVVGPSNRAAANAVIKTMLIGGGNSNPNYQAVEVLECPWLE